MTTPVGHHAREPRCHCLHDRQSEGLLYVVRERHEDIRSGKQCVFEGIIRVGNHLDRQRPGRAGDEGPKLGNRGGVLGGTGENQPDAFAFRDCPLDCQKGDEVVGFRLVAEPSQNEDYQFAVSGPRPARAAALASASGAYAFVSIPKGMIGS